MSIFFNREECPLRRRHPSSAKNQVGSIIILPYLRNARRWRYCREMRRKKASPLWRSRRRKTMGHWFTVATPWTRVPLLLPSRISALTALSSRLVTMPSSSPDSNSGAGMSPRNDENGIPTCRFTCERPHSAAVSFELCVKVKPKSNL